MLGAFLSLENVSLKKKKKIYIPSVYGQPYRQINLADTVTSTFRNVISLVILKMPKHIQPVLLLVQNISQA